LTRVAASSQSYHHHGHHRWGECCLEGSGSTSFQLHSSSRPSVQVIVSHRVASLYTLFASITNFTPAFQPSLSSPSTIMASQSREPEGTPAGEGGVSDTNLPPAMEAPYRDNFDDDTESTPFLQGGEQDGGPSNSSARRPPSDEEQPPAAASQGEDDTSRPRRRFNYVLFHGMTLVLAIMLPLIILAMTLLSELVGRKVRYDLPWSVGYRFQGILFNVSFNHLPTQLHTTNQTTLTIQTQKVGRHNRLGHDQLTPPPPNRNPILPRFRHLAPCLPSPLHARPRYGRLRSHGTGRGFESMSPILRP